MKRPTPNWFIGLCTIVLIIGLLGCNDATATPPPEALAQPTEASSPTSTLPTAESPTSATTPTQTFTPCVPPEAPVMDQSPEISLQSGDKLPIRAKSANAQTFTWKLSGDGSLSSETGDVIIYTAPDKTGSLATLAVVASNDCGEISSASLIIQIANMTVPLDQIGIPAGWMTNGVQEPANYLTMQQITTDCKTSSCYQFTYKPGNIWAGILWWPPACGSSGTPVAWAAAKNGSCGISVFKQADITPKALTLWARGEVGGEILEFKVGAGDIQPSPAESTGSITLEPAWKQYSISLEGMDLGDATALFTWVAADLGNTAPITFYLDSIQFEGTR